MEGMTIREFAFRVIFPKDSEAENNNSSLLSLSSVIPPQPASAVPETQCEPSSTLLTQRERKVRVAIARADSFVSRSILLGRIMDMMNANTTDAILQKIKIRCQNPILVYFAFFCY